MQIFSNRELNNQSVLKTQSILEGSYVKSSEPIIRVRSEKIKKLVRKHNPFITNDFKQDIPHGLELIDFLNNYYADMIIPVEYSIQPVYQPSQGLNAGNYYRKPMKFSSAVRRCFDINEIINYYMSALPIKRFFS